MDYNIDMNKINRGFTLIELMITLAIFGLLAAFAAPSVTGLMRSNRLTAQTNEFISAINIARSEAVKRSSVVTLCITDGNATPNCDAASTSWQTGWIIFTDLNGDASFDNATESLIRIHEELSDDYTLLSTHFELVAYNLQYSPTGVLRPRDAVSATSTQRTFTLCDPYTGNQKRAKAINVSKLGSINLGLDTDSDSIANDITYTNVTCPVATK